MAAVALMLVLVATVLTDATPIMTQVEVLQRQVLTLNGVLDHVIKEFGNLRQRHEDLETKFNGLSVELSSLRKQQEMMNLRKDRNLGKPLEEQRGFSQRQSWNGTMFKPTFTLQDHWKGQGQSSANAGTKGDKGDAGLPGSKGDPGLTGPKGNAGLTGPKGDAGQLGLKGDAGQRGPQGSTGHSGGQGLPGNKGQKGHTGSKGEPGVHGVQQKIAFYAELRKDLGPLTDNEIIIMNDSLVQLGTGYDKITGIFNCPVAGLYVFSVTIVIERYGDVEVELYKNGQGFLSIYAGDEEKHGSGTNMALVELQVNDKVWVQVHDHYYVQGEGFLNHFTTFSGFLLYPQ